jgi:anti-anti-sigma factor
MTMGADRQTASAHYGVNLLTVCAERMGSITIVRVDGEVDMQTCDTLRTAMADEMTAQPKALILDLSAVRFFGSAGVFALLEAGELCRDRGASLFLVTTRREVLRPVLASGFRDLFRFGPSLVEAVADARLLA